MLKLIVALFVPLAIAGCNNDNSLDGQVDKCVQAGIASNEPFEGKAERTDYEFRVRLHCMRVAAGKG